MKRIILIFLALVPLITAAQDAYLRRDLIINGGMALIPYRKVTYPGTDPATRALPVFASVEYGFTPIISAGIFAGYYSTTYRYLSPIPGEEAGDRVFKSRFLPVGLKGTFHLTPFLEKRTGTNLLSEDLDLYASALLGYEFNFLTRTEGIDIAKKSRPVAGLVVGARYFFHYRFAVFGEIGPGILGLGALGVTLRF